MYVSKANTASNGLWANVQHVMPHIKCEYKSISLLLKTKHNQTKQDVDKLDGVGFHWVTHRTNARSICFWIHAFVFCLCTMWWVRAFSFRYNLLGCRPIKSTRKNDGVWLREINSQCFQSLMTMKWKIRNQIPGKSLTLCVQAQTVMRCNQTEWKTRIKPLVLGYSGHLRKYGKTFRARLGNL